MDFFKLFKLNPDDEYDDIINEANEKSDAIIAKAHAEASEIINKAENQAHQLEIKALSDLRKQKREMMVSPLRAIDL